jgi:FolB domain-containing protein
MSDKIVIEDLEVHSQIGITAAERGKPQRLLVTIEIGHPLQKAGQTGNLEETIDYDEVAKRIRGLAENKERALIETLAEEVAQTVLDEFRAMKVGVTVKKFILSDTRFVAVSIKRKRKT